MNRKNRSSKKQGGFIVTIELLLLAAILVIGLIVGMTNVRDAALTELSDLSESIGALNQSYSIDGVTNAAFTASTAGSTWQDARDTNVAVDSGFGTDGDATLNGDLVFNPATIDEANPSPLLP